MASYSRIVAWCNKKKCQLVIAHFHTTKFVIEKRYVQELSVGQKPFEPESDGDYCSREFP